MERMKTFFTYALLIVGFFALSLFLEDGLLKAMYSEISGDIDENFTVENSNSNFSIENFSATASKTNGYISFDFVNTTGKFIEKCYIRIDLYNKQDLLAATKYVEIKDINPEESRKVYVKFKANNIKRFNISIVEETPDKTNIINILGWELDLTNAFGLGIDLTKFSIFGRKITDFIGNTDFNDAKNKWLGFFRWFINWFTVTASAVPWWGYFFGWLIIVGLI